jgi:hypothetical protein
VGRRAACRLPVFDGERVAIMFADERPERRHRYDDMTISSIALAIVITDGWG